MYHQNLAETEPEPSDGAMADCVRAWAAAVAGFSCRPTSLAKVERWLAGLTRRLVTVLDTEPFTTESAYHVGAALVDADLADPEVLSRTIEVLGHRLPGCAGGADDAEFRIHLARTLGALGSGFAQALRRRALDDQKALRRATTRAPAESGEISAAVAERLRSAFAGAAIGIAIADTRGRIVEANRSLADLLGYDIDQLPGIDLVGLAHRDDAADVWAQIRNLLADGTADEVRFERRLIRRDSGVLWALLALSLIRDSSADPGCIMIMVHDVTDHHHVQLRLRHQAFHDPLTGLPNRALLAERIHQLFAAARAGTRAGVCFVDLDGFKAVNDRLGHDVGDRLLATAAARINGCVTTDGHLVARVGGDEFVILVADDAAPGVAVEIAERVLQGLASPFRIEDHELWISASIGVVERPVATTSPAELLRAADITMQRAKAGGKGRWTLFDPDSDSPVVTRGTFLASVQAEGGAVVDHERYL